jgi:type I restriction enzyme M protein
MKNISEKLKQKLRQHYQELDSIGLSSEDSTIILFLLTLLKEKIDFQIKHNISSLDNTPSLFKNDNPQLELNVEYPKIELSNVSEKHQYLLAINEIFNNRLRILSTRSYDKVVQILEEIIEEDLRTHYSEIFEAFLNFIVERQGKKSGEFILPTEIGSFLMQLADQEDNASIFNPFSGFSTFGIHLKGNQQYHAQEINSLVWAVSMLRLNAFGRISNSRLQNADTFSNWPVSDKYDLIISNPPFRLKLDKNQQHKFSGIKTVEGFIIEEGLPLLSDQGKLITLVPMSFLSSSSGDKKVREQLINADILEAVISMPSGLLMQTNIPFAVLLINKKKVNKGVIAFIKSENFTIKNGKKLLLDTKPLLDVCRKTLEVHLDKNQLQEPIAEYQSGNINNKSISIEEIIDLDYNLNVDRYQLDKISGIALRELVKAFPTKSNRDIQKQILIKEPVLGGISILANKGNILKGKSILTRDLKNDPFDYVVDLDNIDADELKHGRVLRGNPILVALVGNNLKPSYVDSKKDFFYINQNIFPFSINDEILDRDWFINQLHSDHVKRQAEILGLGVAQQFLKKDDFLSIKINVPSLKEQKQEISKLKRALVKIDGLETEIIQQNSFLRHTLAGPITDLEDAIKNIDSIINNISKTSFASIKTTKLSKAHLYTLGEYLDDSKKKYFHST